MVKVFIIIGLLLVIASVPGLYWSSFQSDQQQQVIAVCKSKYKHQVEDYVQKLTGSSLKPTDENAVSLAAASAPDPEKMKPGERLQYQQERLLADIDELADLSKAAPPDADVIYGDGWRQKVADYKNRKQSITTVQVASATSAIAGGVLFFTAFIFLFFRIIAKVIGWIIGVFRHTNSSDVSIRQDKSAPEKRVAPQASPVPYVPIQAAKTGGTTAEEFRKLLVAQTESLKETVDQLKNLAGVLNERAAEHDHNLSKRLEKGFKSQAENFRHENNLLKTLAEDIRKAVESQSNELSKAIENSTTSYADAVKGETEKTRQNAQASHDETIRLYVGGINSIKQQIEEMAKAVQAAASQQPISAGILTQFEQAVNAQTESIRKEIEPLSQIPAALSQTMEHIQNHKSGDGVDAQLKQDTSRVRQISEQTLERSETISRSIADLTEQVAAIREYAARQQQRLAKLQDGYDWNLIKNFCLRVVRCIDNLDDRIGELSCSGGNAEHLLPVRAELLFILESNGIEPFGTKIESDYRGQENRLQVLNERDETDDSQLIGRIAQVVRPGYQCRVNDEYTKIIRPAQVRLYGPACLSNAAVRGE